MLTPLPHRLPDPGDFAQSDAIRVVDASSGAEIARAVVNYSAAQAKELLGKHSSSYASVLGWNGPEEVAHRHNLVLLSDPAAKADDAEGGVDVA